MFLSDFPGNGIMIGFFFMFLEDVHEASKFQMGCSMMISCTADIIGFWASKVNPKVNRILPSIFA